jgi:glycerol-3-phosphate dehydrogenase
VLAEAGETDPAVAARLCRLYGSVAENILQTAARVETGFERLPGTDAIAAEIDYGVASEYCLALSDFIARRSGLGDLALPPAPLLECCAGRMGRLLGWNADRQQAEIDAVQAAFEPVGQVEA